ncbi:DUF3732 domain-containing protein [Chitinophaga oryziterrae]|uniref:DUF3732 domain-containing protein n=1 Tax=Chitinophaga oryziterrae TaxID=1031224 RepID=A0A6N8J5K0_9BACT|nr:DUF3732 domain-containing protein [Chitinophaga oryziterrae]MVT40204.1 DUF3732 domain-containing protein [Chitinophaga oryziterrae]
MNLQLLQLIIWPKNKQFPPRNVEFKPGMLNVITGASRTGKSAIIPIIDYCFASSDCYIPIDTIRDHSSWYGIVFQTYQEQVLLARRVPVGNHVSNDFYLLRSEHISVPIEITEKNETSDGIKNYLNTISGVPYFSLEGDDEKKGFTARLAFRDLMALVFQTQDIVANQNILFYKTHAHEHRERLRNWFPYILGAENIETLKARQRILVVEKRLHQLRREYDRTKSISSAWRANMEGHLIIAKEYGLLRDDIIKDTDPELLLGIAKNVLQLIPEHSLTEFKDINSANSNIAELENQERSISFQIGVIKKRLSDVKRLSSGLTDYENSVRRRVDRLQISKWLEEVSTRSQGCPACGNNDHPNSREEFKKISSVFSKIEQESKTLAEVPTSFSREEQRLNDELEILLENKKDFQRRFDIIMQSNSEVRDEFQRRKNMYLFLGHMKASMETFESLADGGELQLEITKLEEEYKTLLGIVDQKNVAAKIEVATTRISQGMLNHLKTLDVESKYKEAAPRFDTKDLNISVLSNDNHWHYLGQVGSASNWVSFHLALMCSLQEYFLSQKASCVPSFVIFDQPSQVYFPKLKRAEIRETDPQFLGEDVEAVKGMFKTIADSIKGKEGQWQGLILDHADDTIYGEIDGVYEVEIWRDGLKLIPEQWYNV